MAYGGRGRRSSWGRSICTSRPEGESAALVVGANRDRRVEGDLIAAAELLGHRVVDVGAEDAGVLPGVVFIEPPAVVGAALEGHGQKRLRRQAGRALGVGSRLAKPSGAPQRSESWAAIGGDAPQGQPRIERRQRLVDVGNAGEDRVVVGRIERGADVDRVAGDDEGEVGDRPLGKGHVVDGLGPVADAASVPTAGVRTSSRPTWLEGGQPPIARAACGHSATAVGSPRKPGGGATRRLRMFGRRRHPRDARSVARVEVQGDAEQIRVRAGLALEGYPVGGEEIGDEGRSARKPNGAGIQLDQRRLRRAGAHTRWAAGARRRRRGAAAGDFGVDGGDRADRRAGADVDA